MWKKEIFNRLWCVVQNILEGYPSPRVTMGYFELLTSIAFIWIPSWVIVCLFYFLFSYRWNQKKKNKIWKVMLNATLIIIFIYRICFMSLTKVNNSAQMCKYYTENVLLKLDYFLFKMELGLLWWFTFQIKSQICIIGMNVTTRIQTGINSQWNKIALTHHKDSVIHSFTLVKHWG